jgi:hypothetical protein
MVEYFHGILNECVRMCVFLYEKVRKLLHLYNLITNSLSFPVIRRIPLVT